MARKSAADKAAEKAAADADAEQAAADASTQKALDAVHREWHKQRGTSQNG
jgi:hypothetical protein